MKLSRVSALAGALVVLSSGTQNPALAAGDVGVAAPAAKPAAHSTNVAAPQTPAVAPAAEAAVGTTAPAAETAAPASEGVDISAPAVAKPAAEKRVRSQIKRHDDEEISTGYGKTHGLLGPVTLGPTVGIALPHPANVGIEGRYLDIFGFAFDYGFLPQITISNAKAKITAYDGRVRWFPFRGSFFIGGAYGKQKLTGSKDQTITVSSVSVPVSVSLDVDSTYLAPQMGWRWQWESGFVIGLDFGWQFVMNNKTVLTTNITDPTVLSNPDYQKISDDVNKVGNDIGKTALPNVTLLQFGYMF